MSDTSRKDGKRTHCKRGHPFDESNTVYKKDGSRQCRTCHRNWPVIKAEHAALEAVVTDKGSDVSKPMTERGRKMARTLRENRRRRRVRWLWRAFDHHARLYDERLNNLRYPESLVRRAHADASEFLMLLREEEPLAHLIHWTADTTVSIEDGEHHER